MDIAPPTPTSRAQGTIGVIPIDSIFSPVRKVAYRVENTQVGQMTNFDRLVLDVETNGAIAPGEAVSSAGKTLRELMSLFADMGEGVGLELGERQSESSGSPDLDLPIEALDLSERPRNCLRRAQIKTVGELVQRTADDLLNITNFGQKSLEEVIAKLDELGLVAGGSRRQLMPRPRKGARFGNSGAHEKIILANLAGSLFSRGSGDHDRGQGQGSAAAGREADHKGPHEAISTRGGRSSRPFTTTRS